MTACAEDQLVRESTDLFCHIYIVLNNYVIVVVKQLQKSHNKKAPNQDCCQSAMFVFQFH